VAHVESWSGKETWGTAEDAEAAEQKPIAVILSEAKDLVKVKIFVTTPLVFLCVLRIPLRFPNSTRR
jgi:hypothetical protein